MLNNQDRFPVDEDNLFWELLDATLRDKEWLSEPQLGIYCEINDI